MIPTVKVKIKLLGLVNPSLKLRYLTFGDSMFNKCYKNTSENTHFDFMKVVSRYVDCVCPSTI